MKRTLSWLVVGLWLVPAQVAPPVTGALHGTVEVALSSQRIGSQPGVAELAHRRTLSAADRGRAVVYLETAPRAAFEQPVGGRAHMDQRNETFVPHVLAVTVGTTVDFPNNDRTYHNVFSLSRPRPFDLGRYAAGRSKSITFDRPGIVRVFCDIHSHMSAFILIFAHRYFDVTDDKGRYRIEGIPPGTYEVSVWNEAAPPAARTVTIPPAGGDVEVDFALGFPQSP